MLLSSGRLATVTASTFPNQPSTVEAPSRTYRAVGRNPSRFHILQALVNQIVYNAAAPQAHCLHQNSDLKGVDFACVLERSLKIDFGIPCVHDAALGAKSSCAIKLQQPQVMGTV
jgi:hypothetical protein